MEKVIINSHIHVFTEDHVPLRFLNPVATKVLRVKALRKPLLWLAKLAPGERTFAERYAKFIEVAFKKSQGKVFRLIEGCYPTETQFIILPMDMDHMGAGTARHSIDEQHEELAKLKRNFGNKIHAFFHADPRNPDVLSQLETRFNSGLFSGIKIYPPLGYDANSPSLKGVYEFANTRKLPIMTHCSQGGVRHKKLKKKQANDHTNPRKFESVMQKFPNIKLCLGHFGGHEAWARFRRNDWGEEGQENNWLSIILEMMRSGSYSNLYADISSTIFNFSENVPLLKVLLTEPEIEDKVLFGSDFYMMEKEKFHERDLSVKLRAELGEDLFWKIANKNPKRYLYG
ncbi:MAG: amidohydrolase family protein [Planctomycetota bacterium]|jgi:predicted TIM-barrel fold metal-dependent hydrolase